MISRDHLSNPIHYLKTTFYLPSSIIIGKHPSLRIGFKDVNRPHLWKILSIIILMKS